jgi:hypothetical protein
VGQDIFGDVVGVVLPGPPRPVGPPLRHQEVDGQAPDPGVRRVRSQGGEDAGRGVVVALRADAEAEATVGLLVRGEEAACRAGDGPREGVAERAQHERRVPQLVGGERPAPVGPLGPQDRIEAGLEERSCAGVVEGQERRRGGHGEVEGAVVVGEGGEVAHGGLGDGGPARGPPSERGDGAQLGPVPGPQGGGGPGLERGEGALRDGALGDVGPDLPPARSGDGLEQPDLAADEGRLPPGAGQRDDAADEQRAGRIVEGPGGGVGGTAGVLREPGGGARGRGAGPGVVDLREDERIEPGLERPGVGIGRDASIRGLGPRAPLHCRREPVAHVHLQRPVRRRRAGGW